MAFNWYEIEVESRRRHDEEVRRAARERLAHEAEQASRARRGPGTFRRVLSRIATWPVTRVFWGSRPPAPVTEPVAEQAFRPAGRRRLPDRHTRPVGLRRTRSRSLPRAC
jgi:hypothetical protein